MGPTFGIKGGAAGGGSSQVVPFENLNLHLTGDLHAVTAANNLLSAMVDNRASITATNMGSIRVRSPGNGFSTSTIVRFATSSAVSAPRGRNAARETGFDITATSEVMAVLALATSLRDLRERLGRIVVGYTSDGEPVTSRQLKAAGAMTVIIRDTIKPNLLQTLEHTPVLVHAGPFGNIAHGNSSVVADLIGIHGGEYLITEAGFGSDMGAERFFNIKCQNLRSRPDAAVVVTTVRALKLHSGRHKVIAGRPLPEAMLQENPDEVQLGAANLLAHLAIVRRHGVVPVVAINAFDDDFPSEHAAIREIAASVGARTAVCRHFTEGGKGAVELAEAIVEACEEPSHFRTLYDDGCTLAPEGGDHRHRDLRGRWGRLPPVGNQAARDLRARPDLGRLPVCIAKTHLSISSDPALKGAPRGWRLPVREARANVGAGFVYLVSG